MLLTGNGLVYMDDKDEGAISSRASATGVTFRLGAKGPLVSNLWAQSRVRR
jgi:hypothetical protein